MEIIGVGNTPGTPTLTFADLERTFTQAAYDFKIWLKMESEDESNPQDEEGTFHLDHPSVNSVEYDKSAVIRVNGKKRLLTFVSADVALFWNGKWGWESAE